MFPTLVEKVFYGAVDKCLDAIDLIPGDSRFENFGLNYNITNNKSFEDIKHSLELGADVRVIRGYSTTLLECALSHPDKRVFELLFKAGAPSGIGYSSILAKAVLYEREDVVSFLLNPENGYPKLDLDSALTYAVENKKHKLMQLLLEAGAASYSRDRHGVPVLVLAAERKDYKAVEILLSFGAKSDISDSCDRSALTFAAKNGDIELIKLLYSNGADLEHRDLHGCTPLFMAIQSGEIEAVKELHKLGASIIAEQRLMTVHGKSAVDYATTSDHPEILSYLLRFGAKPSTWGVSGVHYEGQTDFTELTENLLYADPLKLKRRLESLGVRCGDTKLKSDANIRSDGAALTNFERVIVHAAIVASIAAPNNYALCERNFSELISNDIERVESTKGLSWKKYADYLDQRCGGIQNIRDVIREVAEAVVLPRHIREERLSIDAKLEIKPFLEEGATLILRGKSTLDIAAINHQWHKAACMIPKDLRPLKALISSWHPLFEEIELPNGYSAKCLSTPGELEEEGRILSHCVGRGGYSSGCEKGLTHIVSIRHEGLPVATLELGFSDRRTKIKTSDNQYWKVVQFRGMNNAQASSEERHVWDEVVRGIVDEEIALSRKLGITDEYRTIISCTEIERTMGFLASEVDEKLPLILDHYLERLSVSRGRKERALPLIAESKI